MARRRRGQPLLALAGVLVLWVAARAWGPVDRVLEVPLPLPPTVAGRVEPVLAAAPPKSMATSVAVVAPKAPAIETVTVAPARTAQLVVPPPRAVTAAQPDKPSRAAIPPHWRDTDAAAAQPAPSRAVPPPQQIPFGAVPPEIRAGRRWSADGWALWRDKGKAGAALVGGGTYGASQAGAVLRYRIAPDSRFDPRAYFRATTTLSGNREIEGAAGVAVRPLRALPLDLMAEGRVLRFFGDARLRPGETRVRPAVMAVLGPPSMVLPLAVRAEIYAQAGNVGGTGATAFADGQVRAVRDVSVFDGSRFRLEAGVGAWGGAQRGVERFDIGPTTAMRFPIGDKVFGRASLDWRHRVHGDAEPGSGPVVTISAGF
ncbi:hypothetical protein EKN06_10750 [Croceicoccus ponticola]|uniref:Uncharacterized protein n=1 Tax=Croceicoccus ponticola TaxID=2217664 RepID=A0A437GWJ9_9SPHN|nr:hypothetical protein [Croceicoccus ponticola]RVQ66490.1 hypothetical protein EKN06_10750 [Croceicoccus ponticola]